MLGKLRNGYELSPDIINEAYNRPPAKENINFIQAKDCEKIFNNYICEPLLDNTVLYEEYVTKGDCRAVKFSDLSTREKEFYTEEVNVDIKKAVLLCSSTENQKEEIWMCARKKRITSSIAYGLVTYSKRKHTEAEWVKKIYTHLHDEFEGNEDTAHGINCEKYARAKYEERTNYNVTQSGLLIHPNIPWLGFSPDGLVFVDDFLHHIIEIKSPKDGKKLCAEEAVNRCKWIKKSDNGDLFLNKNHAYFTQVQLGMVITSTNKCDLIVYASYDSCVIIEVIIKIQILYLILYQNCN